MVGRPKNYIEENLSGKRFTRWIVIGKEVVKKSNRKRYWLCKCDCGTERLVSKQLLLKGKSKSCGCLRLENLRTNGFKLKGRKFPERRGAGHPNWKGGLTPEYNLVRSSVENKEWKKGVFERDNYTCQKCGDDKGRNLNAHHIENFVSVYNEEDEILFDIKNGITFCDKCHREFHSIYGNKNNSMKQIKQFIDHGK